jgi:transcription-repair coupling factor (superfamily II helicase)
LGSSRWETTKSKTRDAANEIADDLVKLYGTRHSIEGYEFQKDTEYQLEMESAFLYDETEDQIRATEEVKDDMESKFPMDRLLIGDVGFGKTEVALRAAFKAVADSKQVGVLVPTTILAEQHFATFKERLERFPVRIASLSRFRTKSEQKKILNKLKSGGIDIIIGTHRLLSKDVIFQDLGLVIVDEEHRFGVRHKEKLKQMTENIDVLSMTATPIPRTLQLSLSGARDLSKIETPPKERLPIYTEIASLEDDFIREVIMREINRGGQVYFVNNRIQNIRVLEKRLKTILPDLRFVVAHGQMNSDELERVMVDFLHRRYDVLISTAIIESGIDIPNVNTIIINRADQMGLAQLYQLRGRVGRANRRAYAYLLVPSTHTMTDEARSRLQTLESFTHLGAGFQIAMKDLAMRGAGNMLGTKQSGFINSVGFDLYMEMVAKAIQEKQIDKGLSSVPTKETVETDVSTSFETFIPEDYVPDPDQRIDLYRRISGALTLEELDDISEELEDRFGPTKEESQHLLESMRIKVLCTNLGITRLYVKKDRVSGQFIPDDKMQSVINYEMVVPKMLELSENLFIPKFVPGEQLNFTLKYRDSQNHLNVLKYYLMELYEAVKFSA